MGRNSACLCLCPDSAQSMQAPGLGSPAPTLFDAIMELLDTPHPLDMLSEVTAYGPDGGISRYHNPANYTRALGGVLRTRKMAWRPLLPGSSLADAEAKQQSTPGLDGSPGMAASGLWFNPRTGTQKVRYFPEHSCVSADCAKRPVHLVVRIWKVHMELESQTLLYFLCFCMHWQS